MVVEHKGHYEQNVPSSCDGARSVDQANKSILISAMGKNTPSGLQPYMITLKFILRSWLSSFNLKRQMAAFLSFFLPSCHFSTIPNGRFMKE